MPSFSPTNTGRTGTIQSWTVPATGLYRIDAYGAAGGTNTGLGFVGGAGARAATNVTLNSGDIIKILVGQSGTNTANASRGTGGGGGTFVVRGASELLVAAGGGGGAGNYASTAAIHGQAGTSGMAGTVGTYGAGGTGGGGGVNSTYAGGGAGWSANGINSPYGTGGASFTNGGTGGSLYSDGQDGGFGGGGGSYAGSGGGGGYSGGGGGGWSNSGQGGGGGSYVTALGATNTLTTGANTGAGSVSITLVDIAPPTYTSYSAKNVDNNGYDVYVYGVADTDSGVNRVQFPTWTTTNGQDDLVASWSTNPAVSGYQNLFPSPTNFQIYNNYSLPYSLTTLTDYIYDKNVVRASITPDAGHVADFQTGLWNHGVYSLQTYTFKANTKYAVSVFWRPVTYLDTKVGLLASNISGWTDGGTFDQGGGWYRTVAYRDGSVSTDKTDFMFFSFASASAVAGTPMVVDFVCPQLEYGISAGEFMTSSTWKFHVDKAAHNNEMTNYETDIYGWDNTGNNVQFGGLGVTHLAYEAVTTVTPATTIGVTTATLSGNVISVDAAYPTPTLSIDYGLSQSYGSSVSYGNAGVGTYSCNITGLTPNTLYHYRAKLTDANGSYYGADQTFATGTGTIGVSTTSSVEVDSISANLIGNIDSFSGANTVDYGFCWGTAINPTTANNKNTLGVTGTTGAFNYTANGLTPGTLYYVRAYATNSYGTWYGSQKFFTTKMGAIDHGMVYATHTVPTTSDLKVSKGVKNSTGVFTANMSGLTNNTLYYTRPYITTSIGTTYGPETSFTTLSGVAILTTTAISGVTCKAATSGGTISSVGGATINQYGVCWSTSVNPTTADNKTTQGTMGTGAFTSSITGLDQNVTYHVRAYATTDFGTTYGTDLSFTTLKIQYPTADAPVLVSKTPTSLVLKSNANGFKQDWDTNPYTSSSTTVNSVGSSILNVTSTTNDPMINMNALGDFDPNVYRWIEIKYKIISGGATGCEIFFCNDLYTSANGLQRVAASLTADGNWNTVRIDMWTHANWKTQGYITGWRYDWATTSGINMQIDYIALITDDAQVQITCNGETKVSGSTWIGLTRFTDYTTYGYLAATPTHYQGANSSNSIFETLPTVPILTTASATPKVLKASLKGSITDFGGEPNVEGGFCYSSTNTTPTISDTTLVTGASYSSNTIFSGITPSLVKGTLYYVRAYLTNSNGTGYGAVLQVTPDGVTARLSGTTIQAVGEFIEGSTSLQTDVNGNMHAAEFIEVAAQCFRLNHANVSVGLLDETTLK